MSNIPFKLRTLLFVYNNFLDGKEANLSLAEQRAKVLAVASLGTRIFDRHVKIKNITNTSLMGRHGKVPVRIYRPSVKKNLTAIIYFHGGGFVQYNLDSHDNVCRRLAKTNKAVVISVDYRLAPEYKFPIPLDDCYDATKWVLDQHTELGINKSEIFVAGDSAGGNLATVVCRLLLKDENINLAGQILIYPCTDATLKQPSIARLGNGYFLSEEKMNWFMNHYTRNRDDCHNPNVSPLFAKDLIGLPPTFLFTAEYDPLLDDGRKYAELLSASGVDVLYKEYPGMIHGFFNLPYVGGVSMNAYKDVRKFITRVKAEMKVKTR